MYVFYEPDTALFKQFFCNTHKYCGFPLLIILVYHSAQNCKKPLIDIYMTSNSKNQSSYYPGNKNIPGVYQKIINHIPQHDTYCELFFGKGAIFKKMYSQAGTVNYVLNDLNSSLKIPDLKYLRSSFSSVPAVNVLNSLWFNKIPNPFTFLDPPYLHETRPGSTDIYDEFEMSIEDHYDLLLTVRDRKDHIMIIHPVCNLYDTMLSGWFKVPITIRYNTKTSHEALYMNYDISNIPLHTYKYYGSDCWDRQRVTRKIQRLSDKLNALPFHEKNAVLCRIK